MISLRQLQYLSALADHRHFGRAAQACAVTQPALSMQIRELEKGLGVDLVERRLGEVAFTDIGEEVLRRARQVLSATRDLEEAARHGGRLLTGRLRLGVIPSLAPYLLPTILPRLQGRYPELRVELRETQTKILIEELSRGELDGVILALPAEGADLETMPLFADPFLLAVPATDPRDDTRAVSAREIDQDRLILLEEGHCLRDQALAYCSGAGGDGLRGDVRLGATSLATVMQMVANGYGITLLPRVAVDVEVRDARIRLLEFEEPVPGRTVGLAWRRTSPRKDDFLALGQLIRDTFTAQGSTTAAEPTRRRERERSGRRVR